LKEADSKGFFSTKRTEKAMLTNEWQRLRRKETVTAYLTREHGASPSVQPLEASLDSVLDVLQRFYGVFDGAFTYYAALGSGSPFLMQLNW